MANRSKKLTPVEKRIRSLGTVIQRPKEFLACKNLISLISYVYQRHYDIEVFTSNYIVTDDSRDGFARGIAPGNRLCSCELLLFTKHWLQD